jgi:peptidoglycan hydrolase-like protein with peptidoglycan-binding domain
MKLSREQIDSAHRYNRSRAYPKSVWTQVQIRLGVPADGVPGPQTATAAAAFQSQDGMQVDGKIGASTLARLGIEVAAFDGIKRFPGESVFFYLGKLAVDADGAPNAYHPNDTGIDALGNAGRPGNWWGLATDKAGHPYVQGASDPYPGYYVSTTSLCARDYPAHDPRRYVDAAKVPYLVLPRNLKDLIDIGDLRKGDLAAVVRVSAPDALVFAIYADVGPGWEAGHTPGEGSIALAQALGHDPFVGARVKRGIASGVFFVVFPGSGAGTPLSAQDIETRGRKAFADWGGAEALQRAMALAGC